MTHSYIPWSGADITSGSMSNGQAVGEPGNNPIDEFRALVAVKLRRYAMAADEGAADRVGYGVGVLRPARDGLYPFGKRVDHDNEV